MLFLQGTLVKEITSFKKTKIRSRILYLNQGTVPPRVHNSYIYELLMVSGRYDSSLVSWG